MKNRHTKIDLVLVPLELGQHYNKHDRTPCIEWYSVFFTYFVLMLSSIGNYTANNFEVVKFNPPLQTIHLFAFKKNNRYFNTHELMIVYQKIR